MTYEKRIKIFENAVYTALWAVTFIFPIIIYYLRASNGSETFEWSNVRKMWLDILPFFVLFLLHNYLIAPLLFNKQKRTNYLIIMFCLLVFFAVGEAIIGSSRPGRPSLFSRFDGQRPPELPINVIRDSNQARSKMPPPDGDFDPSRRPDDRGPEGNRPDDRGPGGPGSHGPEEFTPRIMDEPVIAQTIIAILLLGMNLGIKEYYRSVKNEKDMEELKRQNLEQELQYLRYQINPHFFMNTLNNIHALVDIDPEQAKSTIVELSRLMRYVLYDGSRPTILLTKEVDFLKHYITLMRLRYTDEVRIGIDIPEDIPEVQVPPLMFVNFIENAFKHGISYQSESFINVALNVRDGFITFSCINSKHESNADEHSGIGLENIQKRLKLLFHDNYTFNINENNRTYEVLLKIPVSYD